MRTQTSIALAVMLVAGAMTTARAQGNVQLNAPRPIDAVESLWTGAAP